MGVDMSRNGMVESVDEAAFNQALAEEVRSTLARQNISQADVARKLGFTPNAMSRRWKGATPWSMAELLTLCDWLGVDAAALMGTAKRIAGQSRPRPATVESPGAVMYDGVAVLAED